jgi:23S rRNA (guanosine2251-2'-O)-methyltransferase
MAKAKNVPIEFVDETVIRRLSFTAASQGIIAYVAPKEYVTLDELLAISKSKNEAPLYCILDGIEDPQNLGAILRTADATGFHGIIIRERRAVGLTPIVAKSSAGAIEYVPVARVVNISQAIEFLKKDNVWVIGIDMAGDTEYGKIDYRAPTAIVIGNEGAGLSDLVRKRCDTIAAIPMKGNISSLNASVAAAIVMYEAFRQRR